MQCPQCQHENTGGKFCGECGARLELRCAACGEPNPPSNKFCQECGARLTTAPPPAQPAAPGPVSYTPQHLAERIISSRAALEGERKQVTVLFADLKGSMELLADRDPEEARRILDPVLERMMDAVHRYEGTVNQVMGDGIMALFGAPVAHEDHAVRACYAALCMQDAVKQYAQDLQRTKGAFIQIRVGLNAGEVVVRTIGSDLRMDYTAVGQTTHLAARMEQLAAPGSILLAPAALQLAEGYLQVKALGPMAVKGVGEPVEVYELLAASTVRSRLQATAARGLTKFVGRDIDLDTLRRTLEQAGTGHGQLVALVGEPGVGKSRLVWEFSHSHRTQGWLILEAGSVSYGKATSYLPVIDLLKSYCGIEHRDDGQRIREKLAGKLLTLDPALGPTLPAFLSLLDVSVDDPTWQALDPPQRRQRTLDALKHLLLRESQRQPLLLVIEDLHWIDAETQALLDSLVESLPTARILLLVNYRPEYEHGWHSKTYYRQLRLDPLPPERADELLAVLLGDATELEPLKRALIERTEGNPFFVEESVRTLIESGVLAGERSSYRLARLFATGQVPATVQAVLAARIDRLSPEDKRLVQAAAVIGKDVPYAILRVIAELPEAALHDGLARLRSAEFLYETSLFPDPEYTFKHALTHEVAYGGLLQERRRELHAQIVDAIETLHHARLGDQIERLAHHAVRGELREKAVHYLRQAGGKAAGRSAPQEARGWFEQALGVLKTLPESQLTLEQSFDIHFELRPVLSQLGEPRRMLEYLREAETLAARLNDDRRRGQGCALMTNAHALLGELDEALVTGSRALEIAGRLGDLRLHILATSYLELAHYYRGDYERVVELSTANLAAVPAEWVNERHGVVVPAWVFDRSLRVMSLAQLGRFAEAAEDEAEAIRLAEPTHHAFTVAWALRAAGTLHLLMGDWEKAHALIERWIEVVRAGNVVIQLPFAVACSVWALAQVGEASKAVHRLQESQQLLEHQAATGMVVTYGWDYQALGRACLQLDRLDEARKLADRAVESAPREPGFAAHALHLLGDIASQPNRFDPESGETHYREALALAEELGMRPLVAHCHLGLGTLYRQTGRDEQAQAELTTAAEMYRAMKMTPWLEKADTALAQVAR